MSITAMWDEDATPHEVTSLEALETLLSRAEADAEAIGLPLCVELLTGPSGARTAHLAVCVGAPRVPVVWGVPRKEEHTSTNGTDAEQPYFACLYGGSHSELPAWSLIPAETALEAARRFFASDGQRPDNVTWDTETAAHSAV